MIGNDTVITEDLLKKLGFKKKEGNVFENNALPYWVKEGVVLLFNETDKNSYLLGIAQSTYEGKYFVATFYWVSVFHAVKQLYRLYTNSYLRIEQQGNRPKTK